VKGVYIQCVRYLEPVQLVQRSEDGTRVFGIDNMTLVVVCLSHCSGWPSSTQTRQRSKAFVKTSSQRGSPSSPLKRRRRLE